MIDDKDYDSINERYIGSEYGDMRRDRKQLMERLIFRNDATVKPLIKQITEQMLNHIKAQTSSGRTSAKNSATSNYPSTK